MLKEHKSEPYYQKLKDKYKSLKKDKDTEERHWKKLEEKIQKMAKKREKKSEVKKQKKVGFAPDDENVIFDATERKWNDNKGQVPGYFIKGKFSPSETKAMMNALCSYVQQNNLGEKSLIDMCSKSAKDIDASYKKAWCQVAECLPNRSVQSIHNHCKRKFNPDNYSGSWTKVEEQALVGLYRTFGTSWKDIARTLNT